MPVRAQRCCATTKRKKAKSLALRFGLRGRQDAGGTEWRRKVAATVREGHDKQLEAKDDINK